LIVMNVVESYIKSVCYTLNQYGIMGK